MANPTSSFIYVRRHKRRALVQIGLLAFMTLGLYVLMGLSGSVFSQLHEIHGYLAKFSIVSPAIGHELDAEVLAAIEDHPGVAAVWVESGVPVRVGSFNLQTSFPILALDQADQAELLNATGVTVSDGRLPQHDQPELALSRPIAANLGVQLGDHVGPADPSEAFLQLPGDFIIVGLLDGPVSLALMPAESLHGLALSEPQIQRLLVLADPDQREGVDSFLVQEIASNRTDVETWDSFRAELDEFQGALQQVMSVVNILVALVMMLVIGVINQLVFSRRTSELGLKHALGIPGRQLLGSIMGEGIWVAFIGTGLGLVFSTGLFYWLSAAVYAPQGLVFPVIDPAALLAVLLLPLAILAITYWSARRLFTRLDPVAVIERGTMTAESAPAGWRRSPAAHPFSATVFYRRHPRRAGMILAAIALMIMAVSFVIFLFAPSLEAEKPIAAYLSQVSVVFLTSELAAGPELAAAIESHPTVETMVMDIPLQISVDLPPLSNVEIPVHAVSTEDMVRLVQLYDFRLMDGRLPTPGRNEVVISQGIAINRGLKVGDSVGRPVAERDDELPVEMVISGIFASPLLQAGPLVAPSSQDVWIGFASLEFVSAEPALSAVPVQYLAIPESGQKDSMDTWLTENAETQPFVVLTQAKFQAELAAIKRSVLLVFSAIEVIIAIVAALSLAVLFYIFVDQRRSEFGMLAAMGFSRRALVLRTTRETAALTGLAWLLGATLCLGILVLINAFVYAPKGLPVNFLDPTPWLFTLPIPLAVIAASTLTMVWMLRRLDPVSVVEAKV